MINVWDLILSTTGCPIKERDFMQITKQKNKKQTKEYEKYVKQFTPKPAYFSNALKAFLVGGAICEAAYLIQSLLEKNGIGEKDAGSIVTVGLVCLAQLLTGLGWFDTITKYAGAGTIVPITGFANSVVAPAIEYKREGYVLGVGSKIFTLAGPVLATGISASVVIGIIYYLMGK